MKYRYKKQVSFGFDASGKRIRKWIYGNTQAEYNAMYNRIKAELETTAPSEITFGSYADKWLITYKVNKSVNTINGYKYYKDKCSSLRIVPIKDIRKSDLQRIINENADHANLCNKIAMTLKQIFNSAIDDGLIASNPAQKLEVPKKAAEEKRAFTSSERNAIKTAVLDTEARFYLDLLYYCGLRRGEALALTRSDFDFKSLLLCVGKSVAFDENKPILKDTKTHRVRYVPIPQAKVKEWKKVVSELPFLCFSRNNEHFTKSAFRVMWKRIDESIQIALGAGNGLTVLPISPHMVRHDYATRLYYVNGISTKKKAEILGHSEKLFIELYSHLDSEKEDMDTFQSAMNF